MNILLIGSGGREHALGDQYGRTGQVDGAVAFLGATYGEVSPDGEDHFAVGADHRPRLQREPEIMAVRRAQVKAGGGGGPGRGAGPRP